MSLRMSNLAVQYTNVVAEYHGKSPEIAFWWGLFVSDSVRPFLSDSSEFQLASIQDDAAGFRKTAS